MWSFFSRDPTKDFGYEIGERKDELENKSIWVLHEGKQKKDGQPVSIFMFDIKSSSEAQVLSKFPNHVGLAKASMKKLKTLRHPNIVSFLDGLETEKMLYIVTEPVVPLEDYLNRQNKSGCNNNLAISWGLHQIVKGLSFLTNDCNFIHNNVCMSSVFVDLAGEWKLGGVDYMYAASGENSTPPVKTLKWLDRYDAPEKAAGGRKPKEKWSADMWGLGCLIWEVFNGTLPQTSALKSPGKLPKNLIPNYCELVGANPKSRPNPAKFINSCKSKGGFMDNKFVDTMLFLEEIQIKETLEKTQFFNSLPPVLDTFPVEFRKHKILPQLLHAFEYGNAGASVLIPLFQVGKLLATEEYQRKIVPCIVKMFSSTDRVTRVKLLQQMENFVEHLSADTINNQIFPSVAQGFMDTNPVVREHTIKSTLHLAGKLNYKNLNEELLKHFARLQSKDDQGGIRTNTTVCLGKIAGYLNPQVRQKVLSSAFMRAIKDPFPPARQAGVLAMAATHNLFTLQEASMRLLPALCMLTMDPEKGVRDQTFRSIKCYLTKLEKVSENPEIAADMEKDILSGGSVNNTTGWAGWAVSGMSSITSKIYKGKPPPAGQKKAAPVSNAKKYPAAVTAEGDTTGSKSTETPPPVAIKSPVETSEETNSNCETEDETWDDAEGWDEDNWGEMDDGTGENSAGLQKHKKSTSNPETDNNITEQDDWDDDDWGNIEEPAHDSPEKMVPARTQLQQANPWGETEFTSEPDDLQTTASYDWGQTTNNEGDFFSSMLTNKPSKPKKILKSHTQPKSTSAPQSSVSSFAPPAVENKPTTKPTQPKQASVSKTKPGEAGAGWDSSAWGNSSGWESKPTEVSTPSSGWTDTWDSLEESGASKAEQARIAREEKKAERQKELAAKRAARNSGALKLGGKKM